MSDAMAERLPFGPGDFVWNWGGSLLGLPVFFHGALLQVMHPVIGAGVDQHSNYVEDPLKRGYGTIRYFTSFIYDPVEARRAQETLRNVHQQVQGIDYHGKKYHALNRDPYAFVWMSFVSPFMHLQRILQPGATPAEVESLYGEVKNWGRLFGVVEELIPETYEEAIAEFDRVCAEVLENTTAAQKLIATARRVPAPWVVPKPLAPLWRPIGAMLARPLDYFNRAYMPPPAREKLDMRWTKSDQALLTAIESLLRALGKLSPIVTAQPFVVPMRWRAYRTGLQSEYAASAAPVRAVTAGR